MNPFLALGLKKEIVDILTFDEPSEIQKKAIPLTLEGHDVIGQSATGSGKTFAFCSGIIQKIKPGKGVQAIVLTPTRELAMQVAEECNKFSKHKMLTTTTVYGGVNINPQIKAMSRTDIVVGTPGRVIDLIERGALDLSNIQVAVLDEADIMVDMGFIDDVREILSYTPEKRQTLLFSATIDDQIDSIISQFMYEPKTVTVQSHVDTSKLQQNFYDIRPHEKFSLLVHLIEQHKPYLALVFCATRRTADVVADNLKSNNIKAQAIHGGLTQNVRTRIIDNCKAGKLHILVCTDVAARGLHIDGVTHVFNYDIPKDPRQYMHRIGRTARAGKEGMALSLLAQQDYQNFARVQQLNPVDIFQEDVPEFAKVHFSMPRRQQGGRPGQGRGGPRRGGNGGGHARNDHRKHSGGRPASGFGGRSNGGPRRSSGPRSGNGGRSRPSGPRTNNGGGRGAPRGGNRR